MTETELYKELGALTKDKDRWQESIPYVSSLLTHDSVKIQAKALWLLGEMGLSYPQSVQDAVPAIASFLDSPEPLLRERAVNALGRIGRGSYPTIEPHWGGLFRFASDEASKVRLAFIWASENIATNAPDIYEGHMPIFEKLLHDADGSAGDLPRPRQAQAGIRQAVYESVAANIGNRRELCRKNPLSGRDQSGRSEINGSGFGGNYDRYIHA